MEGRGAYVQLHDTSVQIQQLSGNVYGRNPLQIWAFGVVEKHETTDTSPKILLGFVLGTIEFFLLQNTEECFTDRIVIPAGEGTMRRRVLLQSQIYSCKSSVIINAKFANILQSFA